MKINFFKKNALFIAAFVVGMLSVSVANFFGGYYCSALAAVTILATIYIFDILENNELRENKFQLITLGVLVLLELVFFVVNDVVGYPVYVRGDIGFFGGLVMGTQIYCSAITIYSLIEFVLAFCKKDTIELVEEEHKIDSFEDKENIKGVHSQKETINSEEETMSTEEKDIKRIAKSNVKKSAPFMEEEK